MNGVILPKNRHAVEPAMAPIHDEVFADQKDESLREKRKRGKRPVAILIEGNQTVGGRDMQHKCSSGDEKPDAQKTGDHGNEEPITQIGYQVALVPPRLAWIAGPKPGENRKDRRQYKRDPQVLYKHFADINDKSDEFLVHVGAMSLSLA